MMNMSDRITLGSGKVYIQEYTGTIPESTSIAVPGNLLGYISGGAEIVYTPSFYEVEDDLGIVSKVWLTKEEVVFKTGVLTWDGKTLEKLCQTARVTEALNKRTVKIGGLKNQNGKKYVLYFVHEDATHGDVTCMIVGSNQTGFTLAYTKDKETVIDAEFKAQSMDEDGTKIIYTETIAAE